MGVDGQTTYDLLKAGQPIPPPVSVRGEIDTGCNVTSVAPWVLRQLGISTSSGIPAVTHTASGPVQVNLFWLSISILDPQNSTSPEFTLPTILVSELPHQLPGSDVQIGLNVLLECNWLLEGPALRVTLEF